MFAGLHNNKITLGNSCQQIRKSCNPKISYTIIDQHIFICKDQHQIPSAEHARCKKYHRHQPAKPQCHTKNLIQGFNIAFSPILRSKNSKAGRRRRQKHILDKLDLGCQRNRRHIILIHSPKHKCICHRYKCKHQILQDDGNHQVP